MKEEKYVEIISTYETRHIQPDSAVNNDQSKTEYIECRICLEEHGPFIVPCRCDGTMKYVHEICLKKWASKRIRKQAEKDEEKGKGKLASIHGVECELCNETISMEVRKNKRLFGCIEAKENSEEHFLPFFPLVIVNITISSGCLSGLIWIVVFSIMLALKSESIDYQKYLDHGAMTWGLLALGAVFCILFLVKSLFELYHMFIKEEYEIIRVISKNYGTSCLNTESIRTTLPDYHQHKEFNPLETMATPTSPHSVSDMFLQNKLSLTRKQLSEKQKIAKEKVFKKLAKLKEFKPNDNDEKIEKETHEESTSSVLQQKTIK